MLVKLLSDADKLHLLDLAKLLSLSDKPLLWGGKRREEINADDLDFNNLSIEQGEQERELITDLQRAAEAQSPWCCPVQSRLIEKLSSFHRLKVENPESRLEAAQRVLKELIGGKAFDLPSVPKVILFELLLVALRDAHISSIEWALLKEFQHHHQLEDFIFEDLLERAEALNREISKTISIVLE